MALQVISTTLRDEQPALVVRDAAGGREVWPIGEEVALSLTGPRRCTGYRLPVEGAEHTACPERAILARGAQCAACTAREHITACLRCDGMRCQNPIRRTRCVAPDNHALYLAAYGPGMIKVGVARWERRRDRLIEQGAKAALVIGRDDGQMVRRSEQMIRAFGTPDRATPAERLQSLTDPGDPDALALILEQRAESLRRRLPPGAARWLDAPEAVPLPRHAPLSHQPTLIRPVPGETITGQVVATSGSLVAIARGGDLVAVDLRALRGLGIERLASVDQGEYQLALDLGA